MKIDDVLIDKLSGLAKLEFDPEAKKEIINDLNKIIRFVEKLNELDTEGVEPLTYMTEEVNTLRDDIAKTSITKEDALKNAPKKDSDYFIVPKVLDKN
jgi:aspartyl-tRNA(Asn)/glutamyl-tRNA(Gln) amidotransferase subunit C